MNVPAAVMRALEAGDLPRAEALVRACLARMPRDSDALRLLAAIAILTGRLAEAERFLLDSAIDERAFIGACADLSSFLCRLGRADGAIMFLDRMIAADPKRLWPLSIKSGVLSSERRADETLEIDRQLVEREPGATVLWMNYANSLKVTGRIEEALEAYRRALELDPANGAAWWERANIRTIPLGEEHIRAMERALPGLRDPFAKVQMMFALGKAYGDLGKFDRSFAHYEQANALRGRLVPYDPRIIREGVRAHEDMPASAFETARREAGGQGEGVIFILGMPRSGSTLVEQILASHPDIEGLGERTELGEIATALLDPAGTHADLPHALAACSPETLEALGQRYLDLTRRHRKTQRPCFTDKMPANWRLVLLIHLALPRAKIIDVRRHPMACCLSVFSTYFNRSTSMPTSLAQLGQYYADYVRLMDWMDATCPGRMHRIRYEQLIERPETEIRRLLAGVDLDFEPGCLRFHENPRPIYTPSAQQVRSPINRRGLERWRDYEPWLSSLKDALGEAGELKTAPAPESFTHS